MIRITIERDAHAGWDGLIGASSEMREFPCIDDAAGWLIEDSDFDKPYTRLMKWERVDDA